MALKLAVKDKRGGVKVVLLEGRLDSQTCVTCEESIRRVVSSKPARLIFDMRNLSYVSSMGIRLILNARKALESHGGSVMMVNLQPQVAKVFEIAAVLPKEAIFASIEEADNYFDHMQRKIIDENADRS